jgi:hypothetical protein
VLRILFVNGKIAFSIDIPFLNPNCSGTNILLTIGSGQESYCMGPYSTGISPCSHAIRLVGPVTIIKAIIGTGQVT